MVEGLDRAAHTHYLEEQKLTVESLLETLKYIDRVPWMGFTMNPRTYAALRDQCSPDPIGTDDTFAGGTEVYRVMGQTEDCLHWNDREAMLLYMKAMDSKFAPKMEDAVE